MSKKILVIISTAEKEKALTGVLYAANAMKNEWIDDLKVCFFGPFEKLVTEDKEVQEHVAKLSEYGVPVACKFIADRDGVSDELANLGYEVDHVGEMVSDYIGEGYVPMVF